MDMYGAGVQSNLWVGLWSKRQGRSMILCKTHWPGYAMPMRPNEAEPAVRECAGSAGMQSRTQSPR